MTRMTDLKLARFLICTLAGWLFGSAANLSAQCQLEWQAGSPLSATNGTVHAIAADPASSRVYVGGYFTVAGTSFVSNVAVWDGVSWQPLGLGVEGIVHDMVLLPNGDLIVAGSISEAGGQPITSIARWDGVAWSQLGNGLGSTPNTLAVLPNGDLAVGGGLLSSGSQMLGRLATWDGTSWAPYGGPGLGIAVTDMESMSNGDLVVCGLLTWPGSSGLQSVATWDGTAWTAVPVAGSVRDLQALPNGELAIVGQLGSNAQLGIWNGSSFQIEDPLVGVGALRAMAVDANGDLIAVGGTYIDPSVARRSNGVWTPLRERGFARSVHVANGLIYVGGSPGGRTSAAEVFDGASWQPLGPMPNARVLALAAQPGVGDGAFVGGDFAAIDGVAANNVAYWNGATWQAMGAGVDGEVLHIAAATDGSVIVSGQFGNAGGAPANQVARWDGSNWSTLGAGPLGSTISSLAVGPLGMVVLMTSAGIEVYDDGVWTLLPPPGAVGSLLDCVVLVTGDIVVAKAGGLSEGVVRWDGLAWHPLGTSPSSGVLALGIEGQLYRSPWQEDGNIQQFDGNAWLSLSGSFNNSVKTITPLPGGRIVVTGSFTWISGQPIQRAAIWDGSSWSEIDGGLPLSTAGNDIYDTTATSSGELWMASTHWVLGGEISAGLARAVPTCAATANTFGAGCVGGVGPLSLEALSLPWIGATVGSNADGFPPGSLALHVLGTSTLSAPLPGPGCTLFVDPIVVDAIVPSQGSATPTFSVPNNPALVGVTVRAQMVGLEFGSGGALQQITSSNALDFAIGAF